MEPEQKNSSSATLSSLKSSLFPFLVYILQGTTGNQGGMDLFPRAWPDQPAAA